MAEAGAGLAEAEYTNRLLSAVEGRPYTPLHQSKDPIVNFYVGALAVWYLWPVAAVILGLIALWWLGPALGLTLIGLGMGAAIGSAASAVGSGLIIGAMVGALLGLIHLRHRVQKGRLKRASATGHDAATAAAHSVASTPTADERDQRTPAPSTAADVHQSVPPPPQASREHSVPVEPSPAQKQRDALAALYEAQDDRARLFGDDEYER